MSKKYGVVVGRFQCDDLTDGHCALINEVAKRHGEHNVIVVVGCARTPANATNPMDYQIRETMIYEAYSRVTVVPLSDHRSNEIWSKNLDELVQTITGLHGAIMYSGRDGFLPHYSGKFEKVQLDFQIECCATDRRIEIGKTPNRFSQEFRRGVIWAHQNRAHQTYETVDCALLRVNEDKSISILLGKKPGETKLRFPGGFVDRDETTFSAAARELYEETGLHTANGFTLIQDYLIDDWRIRRQKGVSHRTFLCVGFYTWGVPKAGDDLAFVDWFPLADIIANADKVMVSEHKALMVQGLNIWLSKNGFLIDTKPEIPDIALPHFLNNGSKSEVSPK